MVGLHVQCNGIGRDRPARARATTATGYESRNSFQVARFQKPGSSSSHSDDACARASIAQNSHSVVLPDPHIVVATMGKKAKSTAKIQKAADRKIDKSTLPPPPPPPEEEVRMFSVSIDR